jgi:hypothetical protein
MLQVTSKQSFEIIKKNLSRKGSYSIHIRGSRSTIVAKNKYVAVFQKGLCSDIENRQKEASALMKTTRQQVSVYIKNNIESGLPKIEKNAPVIYSNKKLWDEIPVNTEFYHIDASHCYWRIAYIMGCITKNTYTKYAKNKDFKSLRLIALAILTTKIKREYYNETVKTHEIECDISLYKQVYQNIRHYTYNNSGAIKDAIPDYCIAYRVDGIYLLPEGLETAKKIFKKNGLLFKVAKCFKADEKNCVNEDGEIKKIV